MQNMIMITTEEGKVLFTGIGSESKLKEFEDKPYWLWTLTDKHIPKQKVRCVFNFDKERFEIDNDMMFNGCLYKKGRHSLAGCKTINDIFDKLKGLVSEMTVIGHKKINGKCLDDLL